MHPHVVAPLRVNGQPIDERALRAIIFFVFLYLGMLRRGRGRGHGRLVVARVDAVTAFESLAASTTTLGGAGPALGFAGPMGSFAPFATSRRSC